MTGSIELDPDGRNLQIRFDYRPDLVEDVKTIPGRRWDRAGKLWRVPASQIDNVVALFMRHGFEMSPEVTSLFAGTQGTLPLPPKSETEPAAPTDATPDALSVSGLNEQVKKAIKGAFPDPVWVVGEVVDYDKNKDRQHVFFTLLEKRGEAIVAQVDVAMFERTAKMIRSKLENLAEPMSIADGIEIRALVRVDLYPKSGRYQLIVEDIDASFTLGKLALSREEILRELREKGLDRRNLELQLPIPALRIGLLASLDSDGFNDFAKEIETSGIGFEVTAYNVRVQGDLLRPTVLAGLRYFAARQNEFDAVCIVRGGGSRTDLAWFDDREVALAVAQHPLKILCGIGHQRDQSVLDVIAHSEKTPTAVADFLIEQVAHAREILADLTRCFVDTVRRVLQAEERRLSDSAHGLRHRVQGALLAERERIQGALGRVRRGTRHALGREHDALVAGGARLKGASRAAVEAARARLLTQETRARLLDPRQVLNRGYTLARDAQGGILTDVAGLQAGAALTVQFRDGTAHTTIDDIKRTPD